MYSVSQYTWEFSNDIKLSTSAWLAGTQPLNTFILDAILGDLRPSDIRFIRSMVQPIYNFYISVEPKVR